MGICWYCYYGWSKQVADVDDKYLALTNEEVMHYGPAHIVWDDENFEMGSIQYCIDSAGKWNEEWNKGRFADEDVALVVESLKELMLIPEEIRCCCPEDYDDENPDKFPPSGVEMVKR